MFDRPRKPGEPEVPTSGTTWQPQAGAVPVEPAPRTAAAPAPAATPASPATPTTTASAARSRVTAVIGPSIQIEGTLRGQEDVYVEGEVTGQVQLQNNTLTIGNAGKLKADVYAHTVFVEGSMEGDLVGSEQVIIRKSARVRGNITSPRVTLEDGASFKGSIEMDAESVKSIFGSIGGAPRPAQARGAAAAPQAVATVSKVGGESR